ncbi:MAG TPA: PQ-loop repeat-containing protein [Pseudoalteromonas prydzensis]|uniref:PQ-loop repeat-containing protein n=1 Tax=Pseudoalteromonas prydzensis TaxID=182141 RepID=A0A7V1GDV7_9GAMM|nr:PQ-loop repeat-containing protein [Pseudoalteromonas prydzensis]HEA16295.1 PQ-loop repeat-containing protein [Pseudoalteromonas prydzensis]
MAHYLPIISSFILAFSFFPLLKKIRKNRSVSGVSLLMMTFGVAQSTYFIAYNLYFERLYMVLPFVVTGMLSGLILYYFARYNAKQQERLLLAGMLGFSLLPFLLLLTPHLDTPTVLNGLTFVGLVMSSIRVMPQTYKTLKSGDISNLSARYFSLQFVAGVCGLLAELAMTTPSTSHVLTFVMILLTNAAQLGCIQYYKMRPVTV